jgi:insertion element IS1 protein InsB
MEFDEMWHFIGQKKETLGPQSRWSWHMANCGLGARQSKASATFRRLYDKVKHLTQCTFYTDAWEAFAKVLPAERHVIGKEHTGCIERDNSNTRHHLGRFTRKTKVVSKCKEMVEYSLRIWHAVTTTELFNTLQRN